MVTSLTAAREKSNEIANVKGLAGDTQRTQGTMSGEMDHWLRAHSVPPLVWIPESMSGGSQLPVTQAPGNLLSLISSDPFIHMHTHTHN